MMRRSREWPYRIYLRNHDTNPDFNSLTLTDMVKGNPTPMTSRVIERGRLLTKSVYADGESEPIIERTYAHQALNNNYIDALYLSRYEIKTKKNIQKYIILLIEFLIFTVLKIFYSVGLK